MRTPSVNTGGAVYSIGGWLFLPNRLNIISFSDTVLT